MSLILPAPAKINLFLRITGRRANGYHELQTLFQLLDFGDTLEFALPDGDPGTLTVTPPWPQVPLRSNLVYRAALALKAATGCARGATVHLHKRIPLGGGLGGGSSDAATTLVALNQLWDLGLSTDQLAAIGLQLGADVPVFVHGRTAWAEGIGDELTPIDLPPTWYLILAPTCQVPTAQIFAHPQLTRNSPPLTIRAFLEQGAENVCQPVVENLYPEVHAARRWLDTFGVAHSGITESGRAQMTGTGSSVFAKFDNQEQAAAVLAGKPAHWSGFIARGVNLSPLYGDPGSDRSTA